MVRRLAVSGAHEISYVFIYPESRPPHCTQQYRSVDAAHPHPLDVWPDPTCEARDLCRFRKHFVSSTRRVSAILIRARVKLRCVEAIYVQRIQVDAFCALSQTPRAARSRGWFKSVNGLNPVDFLEEIVQKYKISTWFVTSVTWCSERVKPGRLPRGNRPKVQDSHLRCRESCRPKASRARTAAKTKTARRRTRRDTRTETSLLLDGDYLDL
ncbi:unnamed protein product [Trichogramma brassicae]|uniref:Uncharacterized protein n=1 Tax=Trichogramma brassicae TaxID=86971 RepID=A0A6H5J8L1_9HYME|nr:unnamed protein product [Trichogramma brassicae]